MTEKEQKIKELLDEISQAILEYEKTTVPMSRRDQEIFRSGFLVGRMSYIKSQMENLHKLF